MEISSVRVIRDLSVITFALFLLTVLIWFPHFLKLNNFFGLNFSEGINTIYRNYDGIEYIVIAKSLYNPNIIGSFGLNLSPIYFSSHFPGYSLAILALTPLIGFLKSMLLTSLIFTLASAIAFYFLVSDFLLCKKPLLLSIIFLILPARWVVVHSVGSPEPMFIFFTILTFYFLLLFNEKKSYSYLILSSFFALLTQLTRPPGVLLFLSIMLYIHWKLLLEIKATSLKKAVMEHLKFFPFLIVPLGLIAIFFLYKLNFGDFFAYFHSGDNIHLSFPPFGVFNKNQRWVGDVWLEDVIYVFLLSILGGIMLLKQKLLPLGFFVLVYTFATIFVSHRDISRYILPVFPFLLISFQKILVSPEFRIVLIIIVFGIYLYVENFLLGNTAPIPNLSIFN